VEAQVYREVIKLFLDFVFKNYQHFVWDPDGLTFILEKKTKMQLRGWKGFIPGSD
jgi:hypothetical protein